MRRVDEAVREVLADAIARHVKDPRVGFVTVTDVNTSPDLRHARVHVSVLGDEEAREACLDGLRSAHGILQREVGHQLRMKRTPTLDFELDDTALRAARLERLMREPGDRREEAE
ncbi:MAG TPA: 30S ribosome-binding factor RbfA [Solirubrobacteraceae bacterium]|nr:30S ribosome-binding factor RbfA [Solirubrobacteraceae bacterium]